MKDKNYYEEKFQDKITQRGKALDRLIAGIYEFVKDNEEILAEMRKIQTILQEENIEKAKEILKEEAPEEEKPA